VNFGSLSLQKAALQFAGLGAALVLWQNLEFEIFVEEIEKQNGGVVADGSGNSMDAKGVGHL
jgi:hypothetical protein